MFIGPALQGARLIGGASQLGRYALGLGSALSTGLTGSAAQSTQPVSRRPEGYSTYGTYTVGGIEYDKDSGRPVYMPPGSVYPSSSVAPFVPAAELDYQNQKSRIAQLTEQDQLLKKYKVADLTKAYNAAKGDERERLGMEIFALTNPDLAKKVKPGQTGYETIQATRQANTPFGSALSAIPSSSTTNYQSAFTAMPADKIVSQAFGGVSGEGMQSILNTTPDLSKAVAGFPAGEKPLGGMSIKDAFTSSVFNPSQDNLSAMQLALLKEAFNKRLK